MADANHTNHANTAKASTAASTSQPQATLSHHTTRQPLAEQPFVAKTIWMINQYASTPQTALGGRHYYLGQALAAQGHQVYVVAGHFHHLQRQVPNFSGSYYIEPIQTGLNYVWLKLPRYQGAHHPQRILNWFIFAWLLRKLPKIIPHSPDVILYSSPSPIASISSRALARQYAVPHVFEVRDIWPLTLIELGGKSAKHPLLKIMQYAEDQAYRHSQYVFSNLYNAVAHMQSRGMDAQKFTWIANGIATNDLAQPQALSAEVLAQLPQGKFIVGYTGSIGLANALDDLIDAAIALKHQPQIHFVLVGQGLETARLKTKAHAAGAQVTLIDPIPKAQIGSMLACFDVCYIGWQPHPLYRFGIAPNKLPEYLYAGKPIIHAFSGAGDLVAQAQAGICVAAQDVPAIVDAIQQLYAMPAEQRAKMGKNGQSYVIQHLRYEKIAQKMLHVLGFALANAPVEHVDEQDPAN